MNNLEKTNTLDRADGELTIDFGALFYSLYKKIWLIAIVVIVFAVSGFSLAKFVIQPNYRTGFSAYVNNTQSQSDRNSLTSSDILASKELVQTYSKILVSNTVLMASAESAELKYSYAELSKMVSTEIQDGTEIIYIYVVADDPKTAYDLADAIASESPSYMAKIIEGSSMKIVDRPQLPSDVYTPNIFRYTLLGALAGLVLILGTLIIKFFLNDSIQNEYTLEKRYEIPVIGIIPDMMDTSSDSSYYKSS